MFITGASSLFSLTACIVAPQLLPSNHVSSIYTMKRTIIFLFATSLFAFSACRKEKVSLSKIKKTLFAEICFRDTLHDFSTIPLTQAVDSFDFVFTNCGEGRLVILGVKASCHCLRVSYPHTPIEPGKESFVRLVYDGRGRQSEYFNKSVRITTNATKEHVTLVVRGKLQ